MTPKDGGPAFPLPDQYTPQGSPTVQGSPGMTLRDWLAGQAVTGALSNDAFTRHAHSKHRGSEPTYFAQIGYDIADAMLKVREASE